MAVRRGVVRWALFLAALVVSASMGSGTAVAAELGDYRWERRPLLLFAPTNSDPRLVETLSRIDASRCDVLVAPASVLSEVRTDPPPTVPI